MGGIGKYQIIIKTGDTTVIIYLKAGGKIELHNNYD